MGEGTWGGGMKISELVKLYDKATTIKKRYETNEIIVKAPKNKKTKLILKDNYEIIRNDKKYIKV